MMKLHLPAVVPNEGARLLARRITAAYRGSLPLACRSMQVPVTTLQRLVNGEIVPGEELVADVARATQGGIQRHHWRQEPLGRWLDAVTIQHAA
ncbi:hypothetical protein NF699_06510 [Sphingomonadaceae bacterium OTU29LAMAA1]|nr:hypothetical protein NF699_06510 [Sphingomonadaceae bacterium OTU29LAMAA1]